MIRWLAIKNWYLYSPRLILGRMLLFIECCIFGGALSSGIWYGVTVIETDPFMLLYWSGLLCLLANIAKTIREQLEVVKYIPRRESL